MPPGNTSFRNPQDAERSIAPVFSESGKEGGGDKLLPDKLETRIVRRKLKELKKAPINARYMEHEQFMRLRENIRKDGVLTSAPLIWPAGGDLILSGNHRVEAAIEAEIEEADCIEIVSEISEEQAVAIQLSHNAIVGQDDPTILAQMYESLPYLEKIYSGLTDADLVETVDIELEQLALVRPNYIAYWFAFLPVEADALDELLGEIGKDSTVHLAHLDDFQQFFDAVVTTKREHDIKNSAVAIRVMADNALASAAAEDGAPEGENAAPENGNSE